MKRQIKVLLSILMVGLLVYGCSKMDSTYKDFVKDGERIYSVNPDTVWISSGRNRLKVNWVLKSAPNVEKYIVYWNNREDSIAGSIKDVLVNDTAAVVIDDLSEGSYEFTVLTFDTDGNPSIGKIGAGEVFGDGFEKSISNRVPKKQVTTSGDDLILNFYEADSLNVDTRITYTDLNGNQAKSGLMRDENTVILSNWKEGTKIYFQSSFLPAKHAIDTFTSSTVGSASITIQTVEADKDLWTEVNLPFDTKGRSGSELKWIWNGKAEDHPNIYYPANNIAPPITFTIDLGRSYTGFSKVEEWGRQATTAANDLGYRGFYSLRDFEVWGIEDTSGAIVNLPPTDSDWESESIAKGWELLTVVNRDDYSVEDGECYAGWSQNITSDGSPVRFVRVRVLKTAYNGDRIQLSEITLWSANVATLNLE